MFLVHDEQAEFRNRREDGGARADDDVGAAFVDRRPVLAPFGIGDVAVEHADAVEPRAEPRHRLRREGDLRHEDDPLPARLDAEAQRPQIDFRLAAAGDAVEQRHVEPAARERRLDPVERRLLLGRRDRRLGAGDGQLQERIGRGFFQQRQEAGLAKFRDDARVRFCEPRQFAGYDFTWNPRERPENASLPRRALLDLRGVREQFLRRARGGNPLDAPRRGARLDDRRQYGVERLAPGTAIIAGHPFRQVAHLLVEERALVQHSENIPDARRMDAGIGRKLDARPRHLALAERHAHPCADRHGPAQRLRHPVMEQFVHGHVQRHGRIKRRCVRHRAPLSAAIRSELELVERPRSIVAKPADTE